MPFGALPASAAAIAAYRRAFVRNFPDESAASFDRLLDGYVPRENVVVRLDAQGRLELGYMLIPKRVVLLQGEHSALLLYGLTADDAHRGTGVVPRLLPADVARLQNECDMLFAQSPNWKIYRAFALLDLDEWVDCLTPPGPKKPVPPACTPDFGQMRETHAAFCGLARFRARVVMDERGLEGFFAVNAAAGDAFLSVPGAYGFYAPARSNAYALTFADGPALGRLLRTLPPGTSFAVPAPLEKFVPAECPRVGRSVVTKAFFAPPGAVPLLCNGAN